MQERNSDSTALVGLIALGAAAELLVALVVVRPLSLLSNPSPIVSYDPIVLFLGNTTTGISKFVIVAAAAFGLYLAAYALALGCHDSRALPIVLGFSTLLGLTLLLSYPNSSPDIFNYIIDGRMAWLHGLNPMTTPRMEAAGDALFNTQQCCAQFTSPYGPTWQLLLVLPARLAGDGFVANTIAFRAISLPFLVGSAFIAARLASIRSRQYAAAAALLVGWSPLVLWEIVSNGHNDMVMTAFALLAIERALRRNWVAAFPLLTVSVLAKYTSIILGPLLLIEALRVEGRNALKPLVVAAAASLGIAAVLTAPFWAGPSTFGQVLGSQLDRFAWSPGWLLATILHGNQPLPSTDNVSLTAAGSEAKFAGTLLFALFYAGLLYRLWTRRDGLLSSAAYTFFFYLTFAAWSFWPWYICTFVAFAAGLVPTRVAKLALVFSATGLFARVILVWAPVLFSPVVSLTEPAAGVLVIFLPPFIYWLAGLPRPQWLVNAFGQSAPDAIG